MSDHTHSHKTPHHHTHPMPPTYLWQSVLVTLFCCLPLGLIAIFFASQVASRWHKGQYVGAMLSSNIARNVAFWAFAIGIIIHVTVLVYFAFVAGLLSAGLFSNLIG